MMRYFKIFFFFAFVATLFGCGEIARYRSHGNKIETDRLAEIKIGVDSAEDVRELLGPPTNIGTFDKHNLYYIFQFTKQRAFFDPDIIERHVVKIKVDDDDIVRDVSVLTEKDGQTIELASRESPTVGKDITVLQQMMGNVGKFRKPH